MADLETLQTRLAEAEAALHQLLTAKKAVEVNDGRRTIRYSHSPLQIDALRSYIAELKVQVGAAQGTPARRAIRFGF